MRMKSLGGGGNPLTYSQTTICMHAANLRNFQEDVSFVPRTQCSVPCYDCFYRVQLYHLQASTRLHPRYLRRCLYCPFIRCMRPVGNFALEKRWRPPGGRVLHELTLAPKVLLSQSSDPPFPPLY